MRDPRVDAYIKALPRWQCELCGRLREVIHAADPQISETIKRTDRPYFVLDGNVCALLAAKDHVNLFLYDGAIVPDPDDTEIRKAGFLAETEEAKARASQAGPLAEAKASQEAIEQQSALLHAAQAVGSEPR